MTLEEIDLSTMTQINKLLIRVIKAITLQLISAVIVLMLIVVTLVIINIIIVLRVLILKQHKPHQQANQITISQINHKDTLLVISIKTNKWDNIVLKRILKRSLKLKRNHILIKINVRKERKEC